MLNNVLKLESEVPVLLLSCKTHIEAPMCFLGRVEWKTLKIKRNLEVRITHVEHVEEHVETMSSYSFLALYITFCTELY